MKIVHCTILILLLCLPGLALAETATPASSGMIGTVMDESGAPLPITQIIVVYEPSGENFTTVADNSGAWSILNLPRGGPYTLHAARLGYKPKEMRNIYLTLPAPRPILVFMTKDGRGGVFY